MKPVSSKVVIGIDPGPTQSAAVGFDGERVILRGIFLNDDLQQQPLWSRQNIFCEMIASYGMAVGASVFETCVWIGRFLEYSIEGSGNEMTLTYRKDIKMHLCHSMRAKDANVRQALLDRIGPQGTKKQPGPTYGVRSHEWAALAVAVYGWDQTFGRTTLGSPPA